MSLQSAVTGSVAASPADAWAPRGTGCIIWFLQSGGDYAASAVAWTDAGASRAGGTRCGYVFN